MNISRSTAARSLPFAAVLLATTCAVASDPVFGEDFEQFDKKNWHEFGAAPEAIEIVEGGPSGSGKCVQITATLGKNTGAHLYRMLDPGLDTCHLRFYVKFEKEHDYIHHFVHLVGYNPPTRYPQGGAGDRPRGDERFSTGIEPWGDWAKHPPPGVWHFYSYGHSDRTSRRAAAYGRRAGTCEG
jgi:hypothetical protein